MPVELIIRSISRDEVTKGHEEKDVSNLQMTFTIYQNEILSSGGCAFFVVKSVPVDPDEAEPGTAHLGHLKHAHLPPNPTSASAP